MLSKHFLSMAEYNTRKAAPRKQRRGTRWRRQYELLKSTIDSQIVVQTQNVEGSNKIAAFRRASRLSLIFRAGDSGRSRNWRPVPACVLEGGAQYITAGMALAQIVPAGQAEGRHPDSETQAKDVGIANPPASIRAPES